MLGKYFKIYIYKTTGIFIERAYMRTKELVGLVHDNQCSKHNTEFTLCSHMCPVAKDTACFGLNCHQSSRLTHRCSESPHCLALTFNLLKLVIQKDFCIFPAPDGAVSSHLPKDRKGCANLCHRGCQPSPPHRCTARAWRSCRANTQGKEHTDYREHPANQVDT